MKKFLTLAALLVTSSLVVQDIARGHGGTYRGPGDTVPPGGSGGGGDSAPDGPAPAAPGSPGGGAPSSPGGIVVAGPSPAALVAQTMSGSSSDLDLTLWTYWWEFNKDAYLNLKDAIHRTSSTTGDLTWYLGSGAAQRPAETMRPSESQVRDDVVPALLGALERETSNDILSGALIALAKIGDENSEHGESAFEQRILPFLKDPNQEIAETAAVALGILANDASVPTLTALLNDSGVGRKLVGSTEVNYRTRSFAAYGLSLIGARTASEAVRQDIVRTLSKVLDARVSRDRDIKVACLIGMGLVPLSTIEPPAGREQEAPTAWESRIGQIEYALEYLNNKNERYLIRSHAPTTLARLLEAEGLNPLLHAQYKVRIATDLLAELEKGSDARNEEIQGVVLALGQIGDTDSDAVDVLIRKALLGVTRRVSDQQARNFSQIALGSVGGRIGDGEDNAKGIAEIQKELLRQLGGGKSGLRPWAGLGVGVMCNRLTEFGETPSSALTSALRTELDGERSPSPAGAYAIAAGIAGDPEAKSIVREKLDLFSEDEPRGYCAVALGLLNDRGAIETIQSIVREARYRPELLQSASIALGLLGDHTLVPDLVEHLEKSRSLATQASITTALGFIGDYRSVDPLVQMLADKGLTERARGFAAVALGIVADKEQLPWNAKISADLNYRASAETLTDTTGTGILNIL